MLAARTRRRRVSPAPTGSVSTVDRMSCTPRDPRDAIDELAGLVAFRRHVARQQHDAVPDAAVHVVEHRVEGIVDDAGHHRLRQAPLVLGARGSPSSLTTRSMPSTRSERSIACVFARSVGTRPARVASPSADGDPHRPEFVDPVEGLVHRTRQCGVG